MIRAFVGIALPAAIRSQLGVQQFLMPLPRAVPPDEMHLTLSFLGEVPEPVLEAAHEGFDALRSPCFALTLAAFGLFGGARPRAVWAGVVPEPALMHLQARTQRVAHVAGAVLDSRRFVPHVTLGRFPPPDADTALRLERAIAAGGLLRAGPFEVTEFVLWRSHVTIKGGHVKSRWYEELARYPLG